MTLIFSKRLVCRKGALYFLVVFACLVGYVIAECFFRDSFEAYSDEICIQDQKHYSNTWFKFLSFMTNMGYGLPISIIVLFYFEVSKNKINAIFLILLTTYLNYFLSIIKMLYHQPRPYMRNPEIQPLFKCGEEWGDPSGHALSGFLFYFIVFNSLRKRLLDLKFTDAGDLSKSRDISGSPNHKGPQDLELKEVSRHGKSKESMPNDCEHNKEHLCPSCKKNMVKGRNDEEQSLCEPCFQDKDKGCFEKNSTKHDIPQSTIVRLFYLCANIFCYGVSLTLIALIGYSRFFFGLHSMNQVLLGWVYSFFYVVFFYYVLTSRKITVNRVLAFLDQISRYSKRKTRLCYSIYVSILMILSFFVPWIIYYRMEKDYKVEQYYIDNMLAKCGKNYMDTHILFYENCFGDIGTISIDFGILFGILSSSGNYSHEEFWPNYLELPLWKKVLRMVILGALAGIIFGIWSAIKFKADPYYSCFLDNGLKGLLLGFLMVMMIPKMYKRLKLDVKGDFMREIEE